MKMPCRWEALRECMQKHAAKMAAAKQQTTASTTYVAAPSVQDKHTACRVLAPYRCMHACTNTLLSDISHCARKCCALHSVQFLQYKGTIRFVKKSDNTQAVTLPSVRITFRDMSFCDYCKLYGGAVLQERVR